MKTWTVIGFWYNDEPVTVAVVEGDVVIYGEATVNDLESSLFQGPWSTPAQAATGTEAEQIAIRAMYATLNRYDDDDDCTAEVKSEPCAVCGNTPTEGTTESGERVCGPHGVADQRNGDDIAWDEDAPQQYREA